uniref:Uncharacterized protein n=1 Tax=Arundo donax TaxID=35708 RepID=A0A0A8XY10_ARUDO
MELFSALHSTTFVTRIRIRNQYSNTDCMMKRLISGAFFLYSRLSLRHPSSMCMKNITQAGFRQY